jgi:hypothetical protein
MKTGRVYKIIPIEGNEIYVGSTFNTTRDRFSRHKTNYKKWKEGDKSVFCSVFDLFDKYGVEGCRMILIKEYEVVDRAHLETKELLWIKKLRAINQRMPFNTQKIKWIRKRYKKQKSKEYYDLNKEVINQKSKEYYDLNKEVINQKKKEYYEVNKEVINQKKKEYYEVNKEHLNQKSKLRNNQKENCPHCNKTMNKSSLARHIKNLHPV